MSVGLQHVSRPGEINVLYSTWTKSGRGFSKEFCSWLSPVYLRWSYGVLDCDILTWELQETCQVFNMWTVRATPVSAHRQRVKNVIWRYVEIFTQTWGELVQHVIFEGLEEVVEVVVENLPTKEEANQNNKNWELSAFKIIFGIFIWSRSVNLTIVLDN